MRTKLLAVAYLIILCQVNGQPFQFRRLSVDDGLSQSAIFASYQDNEGYMWFGTLDGLNRYDGHSFEVFRNDPYDDSSIGNNEIFSLIECPENKLWIGTTNGISVYDPELRRFDRYRIPDRRQGANVINTMHSLGDSILFIGANKGLHILRFLDKQFEMNKYGRLTDRLRDEHINAIVSVGKELWIGTNNGLFIYDVPDRKFNENKANLILAGIVKELLVDKEGFVWLLEGDRIQRLQNTGELLFSQRFEQSTGGRQAIAEQGNLIWFAVGGLKVIDKQDYSIKRLEHDEMNVTSLSSNLITSLYASEDDMVWVGTPGLGINQYDPEAQRLSVIGSDEKLIPKFIRAIHTQDDQKIFVSTNKHIEWFDKSDRKFHILKNQFGAPLKTTDFFLELSGSLIAGAKDKLYLINTTTGIANEINVKGRIWTAVEWGRDIYFGASSGVYRVSRQKLLQEKASIEVGGSGIQLVTDKKIGKINLLFPTGDKLWLLTNSGIKVLVHDTLYNFREVYPDIDLPQSVQNTKSAHRQKDGKIWLANANNGIISLDLVRKVVNQFDERHGLANGNVYGILEDEDDDLWVSTNNGLSKLDLSEQQFYNFSNIEGLQSREFNSGAYFKSLSGMMYFGGVNGLNFFMPEDIMVSEPPMTTKIVSFLLNHEEIEVGKSPLLSRSIEKTDTIRLAYDQNSFEFHFANINFRDAHSNDYQYQLVGFDESWIDAGGHNSASYTNMIPGNYEFQARAINSIGAVPQRGYASLVVIISEPFWRSAPFRFLLAAIILLLLFATVFYMGYKNKVLESLVKERTSEIEKQKRLLLERNRELSNSLAELKRTQALLVHSEKMASLGTLAAGLGHEINNPLNFIKGGLRLLDRKLEDKDKESESFIGMIESGVRRITRLVGSVQRLGESRLGEKQPCEIKELIEDSLIALRSQMSDKVVISKDLDPEILYVKGYNGELQQALHQIFTNAEQSISHRGEIHIETAREGAFAKIQITDSGEGIDAHDRKRVWDPFYTTKDPGKGEGLGLPIAYSVIKNHRGSISMQSRKGEGTSVTIKLPLSQV